jgi:hypothetical protein
MKNVIAGLLALAVGMVPFYLIFFKLAPWLCSLLPAGEWTPILKVVVFIAVAYFGGILISVLCIILGFLAFIAILNLH